jgi:hypothetical protein
MRTAAADPARRIEASSSGRPAGSPAGAGGEGEGEEGRWSVEDDAACIAFQNNNLLKLYHKNTVCKFKALTPT